MGAGYHGGFGHTKGSKAVNKEKQSKHIVGSKYYQEGKSVFIGTVEEASHLIKSFSGTGIQINVNKERIDFGKVIGYYIDPLTGHKEATTIGMVHYSKSGAHIVPAQPKKEN